MLLTYIFIIVPPTIFFYTLSLHDALPISPNGRGSAGCPAGCGASRLRTGRRSAARWWSRCSWCLLLDARSEEHTSELQSRGHIVCRLLLEKKNKVMWDKYY